jgi:hypothetical protein
MFLFSGCFLLFLMTFSFIKIFFDRAILEKTFEPPHEGAKEALVLGVEVFELLVQSDLESLPLLVIQALINQFR